MRAMNPSSVTAVSILLNLLIGLTFVQSISISSGHNNNGLVDGFSTSADYDFQPSSSEASEGIRIENDLLSRPDPYSYSFLEPMEGVVAAMPHHEDRGWLSRWLAVGGEGSVVVQLPSPQDNITLPHRPAAFPSELPPSTTLPISGILVPFPDLPAPAPSSHSAITIATLVDGEGESSSPTPDDLGALASSPIQACLPAHFPPIRFQTPAKPYRIALIERGGCDFATKVRAAQERGAAGVVVGDGVARLGESDEEGRERESLITMFSPEETDSIFIPSVFVSRASYLFLRDLLANGTESGLSDSGLWLEIGRGSDEGGAIGSLLTFALVMPSLFLLITVAMHRIRVARQREADRAPPLVVLSLPERIWTPDIVWEKDDSESESSTSPTRPPSPKMASESPSRSPIFRSTDLVDANDVSIPPPPPICPADIATPPAVTPANPLDAASSSVLPTHPSSKKERTKSVGKRYFSKDECAICMENFVRGEVVRILPCGHVFHKEECDEWLLKWRKLCPTCRADVTLPTGSPVQGTTLTPITPVIDPTASTPSDELRSTSIRDRLRRFWGDLTSSLGFGGIRLDEASQDDEEVYEEPAEEGERVEADPLVRSVSRAESV